MHLDVFLTTHEGLHDARLTRLTVFLLDTYVDKVSFEEFIKKVADDEGADQVAHRARSPVGQFLSLVARDSSHSLSKQMLSLSLLLILRL